MDFSFSAFAASGSGASGAACASAGAPSLIWRTACAIFCTMELISSSVMMRTLA